MAYRLVILHKYLSRYADVSEIIKSIQTLKVVSVLWTKTMGIVNPYNSRTK